MALLTEPKRSNLHGFFGWQRIHQIHSELSSPISFRVPGAKTSRVLPLETLLGLMLPKSVQKWKK